jgi:hypothetical protein
MYVDGELNNHQQQMVEVFVEQNSDLQAELDILLETKLVLDDEIIFDKSTLYKNAEEAVNVNNAEEKFLLYVDNELSTTAKAEVETFVLQHPTYQTNFTLLKNTVLPLELVACPDKESLYKKEEKPVVFMWVRRLSVAAAILLFAVLAWMLVPSANTKNDGVTASNNNANSSQKNVSTGVTQTTAKPLNTENTTVLNSSRKTQIQKDLITITVDRKNKANQLENTASSTQTVVAKNQQQNINGGNNIITQQQKEQIVTTAENNRKTETAVLVNTKNNDVVVSNTVNKQDAIATVQPTVYRQLDTDDADTKNNTVYIGNMEVNKSKLNGFFKSAKKLLAKSKKIVEPEIGYTSNSNTL